MRSGCTSCWSWRAIAAADVSAVIIGTVVPRALHNLEVLAEKYFGVTPLIAGQGAADYGIELDVDEPRRSAPTGRSTRSPRIGRMKAI